MSDEFPLSYEVKESDIDQILAIAREGEEQRVTFRLNDDREPDRLAMCNEAAVTAKRLFGLIIEVTLKIKGQTNAND